MARELYGPMDWGVSLDGYDWRLEAAVGVNRGRPFAGIRLARFASRGPVDTRRFLVWEESLNVIPSSPQTAMYAIGNVIVGGTNHMYEVMARLNAEEAARKNVARHRRK